MFLFPYRVDLELRFTPYMTLLVCLICTFIFPLQYLNQKDLHQSTQVFCQDSSRFFEIVLSTIGKRCDQFLLDVHTNPNSQARLNSISEQSQGLKAFNEQNSDELVSDMLTQQYQEFSQTAPEYFTKQLWHNPLEWNPVRMVTAVFAHASWKHLVGNLLVFFAFAAAVELIIGSFAFVLVLLASSLITGFIYSLFSASTGVYIPTVGLSGVVMTMLALFVFFLPTGRIRCFFWFFVIFKTFAVPAWILAVLYFGWDLYRLFILENPGGINVVAHIAGAIFGYLLGWIWFRERQKEIQDMEYV